MDTYLRRFYKSDSALSKVLYRAITESKMFEKLNAEDEFPGTFKKVGGNADAEG